MERKTCTMCNMEKYINNFYKTYSECKDCNAQEGLNVTMKTKIKHRINRNYIIKKRRKNIITKTKQ